MAHAFLFVDDSALQLQAAWTILEGTFDIACSQLCGLGHYRMRGEYHVVDQAAWDRWQADEVARLR